MQERFGAHVRTIHGSGVVGDMALLRLNDHTRRNATAVATSPTTTLVVPQATFDAVMRAQRDMEVRSKLALFQHVDALKTLSPRAQDALACAMTAVRVQLGETVAHAGEPLTRLLLLQSGTARVLQHCGGGVKPPFAAGVTDTYEEGARTAQPSVDKAAGAVTVEERVGPGQLLGVDAIVHGGVHAYTIVAEAPCKAWALAASVRLARFILLLCGLISFVSLANHRLIEAVVTKLYTLRV